MGDNEGAEESVDSEIETSGELGQSPDDDSDDFPGVFIAASGTGPAETSLKDIADALGVGYDRLRGFADAEGMREITGAQKARQGRGVRYPESAIAQFRALIAAQDRNLVTPKTAAAFLHQAMRAAASPGGGGAGNPFAAPQNPATPRNGVMGQLPGASVGGALATLEGAGSEILDLFGQSGQSAIVDGAGIVSKTEWLDAFRAGVADGVARMQSQPEDELLTMAEARRRYGTPAAVLKRLRVPVEGRLMVRRSDVLAYIRQLGQSPNKDQ